MGESKVWVVGHKNPDTDSICSAISYANLKNQITQSELYEPKRAGHLNEETQFVLKKAGLKAPEYIKDVRPQVKDIEIRRTKGINRDLSVRKAWELMKGLDVVTLPITEGENLEGLVTIGDVSKSYFEVFDNKILATSNTSFTNIVETLNGKVVTGNVENNYVKGKLLIGVANPDILEEMIDEGDIVILGNRYEAQLCAIEMSAGCIIVCEGARVSNTISKIASERGVIVISTEYDTYTVARLMNQAIPVSFFMKQREKLIGFKTRDYIEDIQDIMAKKRFRDFPIEDEEGKYVGMISRRNLLGAGKKNIILVDHNEKTQAVFGIDNAQIQEIIDHHRLGSIETITPVFFRNQPLGCTCTIVYKMYRENNIEISKMMALVMCSAILSDTLIFKSPTCTWEDEAAARDLAVIAGIDPESYGREMFRAGSNLSEKTEEEIFYQDFKRFSVNDTNIGVGQVNVMGMDEVKILVERELNYIPNSIKSTGLDMTFLLVTDIMSEASYVICQGKNALQILRGAFNVENDDYPVLLKGVVSRKKQFLPAIIDEMQS